MSNEFLQAADDAKRLLRGFSAIQTLADAFERAGSLEQAAAEADVKLAKTVPLVEEATQKIALAEKTMRDAELAARLVAADAKIAADVVVGEAHEDAAEVRAVAAATLDAAKAQAVGIVSNAEALALAMSDRRDSLAQEVTELEFRAESARAYLAKLQG